MQWLKDYRSKKSSEKLKFVKKVRQKISSKNFVKKIVKKNVKKIRKIPVEKIRQKYPLKKSVEKKELSGNPRNPKEPTQSNAKVTKENDPIFHLANLGS